MRAEVHTGKNGEIGIIKSAGKICTSAIKTTEKEKVQNRRALPGETRFLNFISAGAK